MTRAPALARLVPLALACAFGCGKTDADKRAGPPYPAPTVETGGEVVARIGDVALTTRELEKRIREQSPLTRAQLANPAERKKFVENEVRYEVLAQEGWRLGLYADPRIQAELRRAIVQRMMRDAVDRVGSEVHVSDEEVRAAYQAKDAEYNKPERIRLSVIVLHARGAADRKAARAKLEALAKQIADAEKRNVSTAFADAARSTSEDTVTKDAGGDLQFLTRDEVVARFGAPVAETWFDKAEIGTMGVSEVPDALLLFKKTGKRRAVDRPLDTVKPQLRAQLLAEKKQKALEQYVEALSKKAEAEISEAALEAIQLEPDAARPAASPPPGALDAGSGEGSDE